MSIRPIAILLIALVAAAGLGTASAKAPTIREEDDRLVLTNGIVTVWFADARPSLTVMPATDLAGALGYSYRYTEIVEYRDLDGDGAPSATEVVARLGPEDANWSIERAETDERATLNFTLQAPVELGLVPADNVTLSDRSANVSLVFTLNESNAIGVQFLVTQWPFVSAQNRLALESVATGAAELEETETTLTATLSTNETTLGNASWAKTAQGVGANGTAVEVPVRTAVAMQGENESRIVHTYDAADLASLAHAAALSVPASGAVESTTNGRLDVPAPGILVGVGALAAAGLATRRRACAP